jgi:CBS domain-containing protein
MRRITLQEAGVSPGAPGAEAVQPDDEALVLEVHGGEVVLVIPAGGAAEEAVEQSRLLRGTLRLESERVLTFAITARAGSSYADSPMAQAERRDSGARRPPAGAAEGRLVTAADIMTREVITTRPNVPVKELAKRLTYHRISGMPVVDEQGTILGVVSEADIISKRGATVADIMTTPVISVTEETPAQEVAALLTQERIKRVPVVRDGKLVGLIGRSNVVSWVGSQGQG